MMLYGCDAPPNTGAAPPGFASSAALSPTAAAVRNRLTNTENGLAVRRLIVNNQPERIVQALASHMDGQAVNDDTLARLKRNGFRLVRVPAEKIDNVIAEMGGASFDGDEWHGQVYDWRSLVDRPIDDAGRAVAIDGFVRRYERGDFRLMIRSWTVQMEDGPFVHLEMLPRRRVSGASHLQRLSGEESPWGGGEQSFGSMALDLQLQAGYAYVLLGDSPQRDWPALDEKSPPPRMSETPKGGPEIESPPHHRTGPFDRIGPEVAAPPTLGELFFAVMRESPARGLLVFIPKIAPELFVSDQK